MTSLRPRVPIRRWHLEGTRHRSASSPIQQSLIILKLMVWSSGGTARSRQPSKPELRTRLGKTACHWFSLGSDQLGETVLMLPPLNFFMGLCSVCQANLFWPLKLTLCLIPFPLSSPPSRHECVPSEQHRLIITTPRYDPPMSLRHSRMRRWSWSF